MRAIETYLGLAGHHEEEEEAIYQNTNIVRERERDQCDHSSVRICIRTVALRSSILYFLFSIRPDELDPIMIATTKKQSTKTQILLEREPFRLESNFLGYSQRAFPSYFLPIKALVHVKSQPIDL